MNLQTPYRYPLDPTGVDPSNLVVDELHTLPNLTVRCLAPTYGGFYTEGVIVRDYISGRELVYDVDYKFGEILELPSDRYCKEICAYIVIYNTQVSKITITYQALGGNYSYSMESIVEMLNSLDLGNRPVEWGLIVGKPIDFPPTSHMHPSSDIYGMEYVVHSLERVRQAIMMGDVASHDEIYAYIDRTGVEFDAKILVLRNELYAHLSDTNNPHNTTKAQVGLGNVQDYGIATSAEAVAGTVNVKYMTPLRVMESINNMLIPVNQHIANKANPHSVTKLQVGLGSVEDYPVASKVEAQTGTAVNRYMSPLRVKEAIDALVGVDLDNHIADKNNPHTVTKAQVGLSAVQNYGIATAAEATAGTSNILYMTPLRVKEAITLQVLTPLNAHINDTTNPHGTTKAQVGLSVVENFGIATTVEAQSGASDVKYSTPLKVKQAIDTFAVAPLNVHIANVNNPHNTTKLQVGLGSVQDYGIATTAEAQAGTSDAKYSTPLKVKQAIDTFAVAPLTAHTGNTNNPHSTTKAQVGLSNVDNYATATQADAQGGTALDKFMTPIRVKQAIDTFAITSPNFTTDVSTTGIMYAATAFAFKSAGEGASDSGIWWEGDGIYQVRSNGVMVARVAPGEFKTVGNFIANGVPAAMVQGNTAGGLQVRTSAGGDAGAAGVVFNANGYYTKLALRSDGIIGFGGGSSAAWRWYMDSAGNTVSAGDVTAYSDPRLKEKFEEILDPEGILEKVDGCIFHWKSGIDENAGRAGQRDYGVLADQVEEILPEFIHYSAASGTTYRTVAYHKFVPILIEAHKAYKARSELRFEELERTVKSLASQLPNTPARF